MANITKKYALNGKGILAIEDDGVCIENTDTGEMINLKDLLKDFADRYIKLSVNYDEDYE
jgi:hypothetical protein